METDEVKYKRWLHHVKVKLWYSGLMRWTVDLCSKSWRMYYDEGLTPVQAVHEDIGKIGHGFKCNLDEQTDNGR
jgi:hypothetical protein